MKNKILPALVVAMITIIAILAIGASAETVVDSGACGAEGDNLTWTLDDEGTLSITGTGAMKDYAAAGDAPWYSRHNSIVKVTIADGVTSIGNYAFCYCSSLASVTIPDSVTRIGNGAFYNCSSLVSVTIPNSVTGIGDSAFEGCSSLVSITIPDSVTSIGYEAFYGCSSLESINVNSGNKNFSSENGVLFDKNKTKIICYPAGKAGSHYSIPDSVTSIGYEAFSFCSSLESVTIGDSVTSIGNYAFFYCSSLESVTIGDSVTSIGDSAFLYCSSLESVTIGDSVTSIGNYAFLYCSSLKSVTIPDSVTSIGDYAFRDCSSLVSITIPDSVTSIGNYAFLYCSSLESVTIGDSVTSIGSWAFSRCSSLASVTIGDSVTSIGYDAFYHCSSLKSITIPDSVTSIGETAFSYCSSLETVYYTGTEEQWNEITISRGNECLTNAEIVFGEVAEVPADYKINSITIKDMSGNSLEEIPEGNFLATVSITNVSASSDAVVILAQYSEDEIFKGLMYIQTEDVPTGSTIKLSVPVANTNGDVARLIAFCWASMGSLTPVGEAVSFPME